MNPKIVVGGDDEEYFKVKALSSSGINLLLDKSPMHLKKALDMGLKKPTAPMIEGSAVHCHVFEPDQFWEKFEVLGKNVRQKKTSTKKALRVDSYNEVCDLSKSVRANRHVKSFLAQDELVIESAIYWTEKVYVNGTLVCVPCKAKIDAWALINVAVIMVDLKTTKDATIKGIKKAIRTYKYYRQAAWYIRALSAIGYECKNYLLIFVEKVIPYMTMPVAVDDNLLNLGYQECESALKMYARCLLDGEWGSYSDDIITLDSGDIFYV